MGLLKTPEWARIPIYRDELRGQENMENPNKRPGKKPRRAGVRVVREACLSGRQVRGH